MTTVNGKQTFLSEAQYQAAQQQLASWRKLLFEQNAGRLADSPQLADLLNEKIDGLVKELEAATGLDQKPADNGLSGLIGIGPDAANGLDKVQVSPSVRSYDEKVASQRLQAIADLYYVHQIEMTGALRAVLKLQELFKAGVVRLSDGQGALGLYQFDRKQVLRYNATDRVQAYLRAFGYRLPGHVSVSPAPYASPNHQFHSLFSGFMAEVARFFRDKRISEVVRERANDPSFGSIAIVRRAGLDLRYNLENFSHGHLYILRIETLQLIDEAFSILRSKDVQNLFGATNEWEVVEDVLRRYFGLHVNVSPRSRMAETGRTVLRWLAQPFILTEMRSKFEGLAQSIAEPAEEWLASAQTVGVAVRVPDSARPRLGGRGQLMAL